MIPKPIKILNPFNIGSWWQCGDKYAWLPSPNDGDKNTEWYSLNELDPYVQKWIVLDKIKQTKLGKLFE